MQGTLVRSLDWEGPLGKTTHSSIPAPRIPWGAHHLNSYSIKLRSKSNGFVRTYAHISSLKLRKYNDLDENTKNLGQSFLNMKNGQ